MKGLLRLLPGPQSIMVRYGATTLLVLIAFGARYAVGDSAGPYAFLIFIGPIVLAGLVFDRGTGFFAIALSTALISSLLTWDDRSQVHIAALSLFVVVSGFLVLASEGLHKALESENRAHAATALLLQEMSHRVKNKFAVIASIIALEARHNSPEVRKALDSVGNRVRVIAAIHDSLQLSRHNGSIEMKEYLEGLCHSLEAALNSSKRSIALSCNCAQLLLPPDRALAIGLLVNELVTNAFKYAFAEGGGRVEVELSRHAETMLLRVSDDGKGCPQQPSEGLGARLVKTFAEQLGGAAVWEEGPVSGCVVTVSFPLAGP